MRGSPAPMGTPTSALLPTGTAQGTHPCPCMWVAAPMLGGALSGAAPWQDTAAPDTQTRPGGGEARVLSQLPGAPRHFEQILPCGCKGTGCRGAGLFPAPAPHGRRGGRSTRAGNIFKYKFPFPLEILDRPDLLSQFLAPCCRASSSPQDCLINRLYSAEAVNLSHPLRFAPLMYFHVYKFF